MSQVQEIRSSQQPPPIMDGDSGVPVLDKADLVYDDIITKYAQQQRFAWFEIGQAASIIKLRELWKVFPIEVGQEPFKGFDDYVNRRGQKGRSTIYRAWKLFDGLNQIGETNCRSISQANAIWLLRCKDRLGEKKGLSDQFISNAMAMQEKEYASFCNDNLPGAAKEETQHDRSWRLDKSLATIVDRAVKIAMWEEETEDEKVAIERVITYYLEGGCEKEGFANLSNQQAYAKSHGRKSKPSTGKKRGRPAGSKNKPKE